MSNVVSTIARYLSNDVNALNVVSQNVANMGTVGYRTERLKTDFRTGVINASPSLDNADGSIDMTGRALDLAIQGPGFFVVDVGGHEMLTRNGQLHLDAEQRLVDASGHPVLGQSGPIVLAHDGVKINAAGEILDGGTSIDTLRVMAVQSPEGLHEAGQSLYSYSGEPGTWNGRVQQGALERSNVDAATEMVRLMQLTRHAQSVQRALQAYDQAMQTGINHIGDNS